MTESPQSRTRAAARPVAGLRGSAMDRPLSAAGPGPNSRLRSPGPAAATAAGCAAYLSDTSLGL